MRAGGDCDSCAAQGFYDCPVHILEAAAHGADAILLIAAILSEREIRDFRETGGALRHGRAGGGARPAGTGRGDRGRQRHHRRQQPQSQHLSGHAGYFARLAEHMPAGAFWSVRAGFTMPPISRGCAAAGYTAFLVGEHLMKSGDPAAALRRLVAA